MLEWILAGAKTAATSAAEFEQIFTRHYRAVFYFFASQTVSEQDCQDLTQDTFLRVYKGMGDFRSETSLREWILLIAMNVWKNELRRRSAFKRVGKEIPIEQIGEPAGEDGGGLELPETGTAGRPADQVLAADEVRALHQAVRGLPSQMRRCAVLRFVHELSYREVAAVMQISIETVKSQLYQARQRLRIEMT